ncbi:PREDICTED: cytochrome c oxidase assembly factor 3, mitochondrial [Wasmannia auropunctata]|uniref:cytochrome c oxidase assembly factor 3, mitochondrial n=1 Tax=Wasmannia auropunctata TaxID=64793 RepID=UPI0005EDD6DC|nr:PREDICTED: cytochrome c oxidase assembly factor 3, mitochondrial [Wasmannia auropunctata]
MGPDRLEQSEAMPKVDILKDAGRIKSTDKVYMKRMEEQNLQRVKVVQKYRKANNRTAITLGLGVIGIYAYTIYSVKQEKFLDDFEVPEKTIKKIT